MEKGKNEKTIEKIKVEKYTSEQQQEVIKLLKVVFGVVLIVVIMYFFTRAFITKDLFNKKVDDMAITEGVINYDTTIIGQIFDKVEKEYYAIIYDASSDKAVYYSTLITLYQRNMTDNEKANRIYFADLSNEVFNKPYYTDNEEEINVNTTDLSKFKVGDLTLLKIKNGKITKVIQTDEEFAKELAID